MESKVTSFYDILVFQFLSDLHLPKILIIRGLVLTPYAWRIVSLTFKMYLFNYSISKTHTIFIIVRKYSDRKSKANIENQFSRGPFRRKCLLEAKHPVRKWVAEEEFAWLELLSGYDRFTTPYIRIFPGRDMATIGTGIGGEGERGR